jgi:hypothetical protein
VVHGTRKKVRRIEKWLGEEEDGGRRMGVGE